MQFSSPLALLLLLVLPFFFWLGWPSRGYGRRREISSLVLRTLILLLLIFALAGLEIRRGGDNLAVVYLVDASDSMPQEAEAAAFDYVRESMNMMGTDDQAAVILFGGDALVERPMSANKSLDSFASLPDTSQTDLASAIRLGMALYPPGSARRMIILSDGAQTDGDAIDAAQVARSAGVDVIVVPFVFSSQNEAMVVSVDAPDRLIEGESFDLTVTTRSAVATQAGIRVLAGGQIIFEGQVNLEPGLQTFQVPLSASDSGFLHFSVQLIPAIDGFYQNNELATYSQVAGPPKILLVAPPAGETMPVVGEVRPDEFSQIQNALLAAGFDITLILPSGLPSELPLLAEFASIVLIDVPARDLTDRQMLAVQSYVRDLGGGLVTVGGPTSYGVGGYFRTPLEETLPVDMEIKDEKRRPSLTMVFVIDRSGSMSTNAGAFSKLDLAKEAVVRSVELLFPSDRIGVIAFDSEAQWVVPITDLSDPGGVQDRVGTLRPGGGTDIMAGLMAMASQLPQDPARLKHVILLTDGGADPEGLLELTAQLFTDHGITLSTVGIGEDSATFLADLAVAGGGRFHLTENPANIPTIFTEETTLATRAYIIEESFFPLLASSSSILAGIEATPPLHGYVGSTSKSTAQTILVSELGDPILATWQYGLGRAVAFTSDATARWASDWVSWSGFPSFWAQVVRSTVGDNIQTGLAVRVEQDQGQTRLVVDAQNETGLYLNNYGMVATLLLPDGSSQEVELVQTAPGRYEAPISPDVEGAYLIRVDGESPDGENISTLDGWVYAYSPEYQALNADPDEMIRLAAAMNGRITSGDPAEVFEHDLTAPRDSRPVWPLLLLIAALLLPFDIAVRRLAFSFADLGAGLVRRWRGLRLTVAGPAPEERTERMSSLLEAKERTRESSPPPIVIVSETERRVKAPTINPLPYSKAKPTGDVQDELEGNPPSPVRGEPAPEDPDSAERTTSALLANKRARKKRDGS
jgi:Mg-chelatase subunit ChlD